MTRARSHTHLVDPTMVDYLMKPDGGGGPTRSHDEALALAVEKRFTLCGANGTIVETGPSCAHCQQGGSSVKGKVRPSSRRARVATLSEKVREAHRRVESVAGPCCDVCLGSEEYPCDVIALLDELGV